MLSEPGEEQAGVATAVAEQAPAFGAAEQIPAPDAKLEATKAVQQPSELEQLRVENARLTGEMKRLTQIDKTQRGAQSARDRETNTLRDTVQRLDRKLSIMAARMPKDIAGDAVAADQEEQNVRRSFNDEDQRAFKEAKDEISRDVRESLTQAGFSPTETERFIDNDENLQEAREIWNEAVETGDKRRLQQSLRVALRVIKMVTPPSKVQEGAANGAQSRPSNGSKPSAGASAGSGRNFSALDLDAGHGSSGAVAGLAAYVDKLKKGQDLPSPAEIDRMTTTEYLR